MLREPVGRLLGERLRERVGVDASRPDVGPVLDVILVEHALLAAAVDADGRDVHDAPDAGRRRRLAHVHRAVDVRAHVIGPGLVAQRQQRGIRDHGVGAAEARCEAIRLGEIGAAQLDPALAQLGHAVGIAHDADHAGSAPEQTLDEIAAEEARGSRHRDRRSCELHARLHCVPPSHSTDRRFRLGAGAVS